MQRTGTNRRVVLIILYVALFAVLVAIDQLTKIYFTEKYLTEGQTEVIKGFFFFSYAENTGSAFSLLADKEWGQLFFKVITVIALVIFVAYIVYSHKKNTKWLTFSLIVIVAGTVGNFIDRLAFSYVRDFISFIFGNYRFPIFNVADICLVVGVIMVIIYYFFLDENAIFKKKDGKKELPSKDGE